MSDSGTSDDEGSESERLLTNSGRALRENGACNGRGSDSDNGEVRKNGTHNYNEDVQEIMDRERFTPWCKVAALTLCCVGCIGLTVLKGGGHTNPLNIKC